MGAPSVKAHRDRRVAPSSARGAGFSIGRYGYATQWQSIPAEVSILEHLSYVLSLTFDYIAGIDC